jgi:hypothetical protein
VSGTAERRNFLKHRDTELTEGRSVSASLISVSSVSLCFQKCALGGWLRLAPPKESVEKCETKDFRTLLPPGIECLQESIRDGELLQASGTVEDNFSTLGNPQENAFSRRRRRTQRSLLDTLSEALDDFCFADGIA